METLQKVLHPSSMLQSEKVVVVTGADKGIGYSIVKGILKQEPNWTVYLTARDRRKGEDAVKRCYDEIRLTPRFFELDIDSLDSIQRFRDHIKATHKNGIYILINNAGINPDVDAKHRGKVSPRLEREAWPTKSATESLGSHREAEVVEAGRDSARSSETREVRRDVSPSKRLATGESTERREGERREGERREGERREGELREGERREESKDKKEKKDKDVVEFKFDSDTFRKIVKTNYFSTLTVCQELFPLLGDDARVIFLGTRLSQVAFMNTKEELQMRLKGCVRVEDVSKLMEQLMNMDLDKLYSSEDKESKDAWLDKSPDLEVIPNYKLGAIYPWAMAKLGLILVAQIYQSQFDSEKKNQNLHVNVVGPGLVRTDSNPNGVKSPDEGADSVVWLALQPNSSKIKGEFVCERKVREKFFIPKDQPIFP